MSAEEKNKALARKFFEEAWGKGNLAAVDEFIAADYVMYPIPPGLPPGPEGTKQAISTYRTAFPNLKATVDDIFAADDRVAFRWSFRGTHLGDWWMAKEDPRHPRHRARYVPDPDLGCLDSQPHLALPGCRSPRAGAHRAGATGVAAHSASFTA